MTDSRNWLVGIAAALVAAGSASAGTQIDCSMSVQPPIVRDGGVTEYVGEIDLKCDSTVVTNDVTADFALSLNTTVTNATQPNAIDNLGPLTMAGLAVQNYSAPQTVLQTVQGRVGNNALGVNNTLRFPNAVLPHGQQFVVHLFNTRAMALPLTAGFPGTQIFALVTVSIKNPAGYTLAITNQPAEGILAGFVQPAMKVAVTDCTGQPPILKQPSLPVCVDVPPAKLPPPGGKETIHVYGVTFTELQQVAFKNIVEEDGVTLQGTSTSHPNPQICDTAHGGSGDEAVIGEGSWVPACASPAWVSNATRLMAQFQVPPKLVGKIHILVSRLQTASHSACTARLATVTNGQGWGKSAYTPTTTAVACKGKGGAPNNVWVELPDGATETATWEVTSDDMGVIDSITFAWTIAMSDSSALNLPQPGTVWPSVALNGMMAPVSTQSTPAPAALTDQPVVRFKEKSMGTKLTPGVCAQ